MPRTCVFDTARNAIMVTASGVLSEAEFRLGVEATVRDPRFKPDERMLLDFTEVVDFAVSATALADVVSARHFSAKSRRAFIVSPGFGRAFVEFGKVFGAIEQIQIFDDRVSALAWLNEGAAPADLLT